MRTTSGSSSARSPRSMSMRFRSGRALVAGAAVAVAVVAGSACSSSDSPNADATSTTTAAAAGAGGSTSSAPSTTGAETGGDGTSTTAVPVAEHGPLPTVDLDDREQAFVDALMSQETPAGMDDEQAQCIAGHWIDAVGVDAVEAGGVTAAGIADGTSSINDIPVDRATAEKVVDSYETCEFDLVNLVVTGFSSMVQGDPTKQACLEQAVTPEVARDYMIAALMATESGAPDLSAIQALIQPCLT